MDVVPLYRLLSLSMQLEKAKAIEERERVEE